MRYILTPIGSGGDVGPFIEIGRQLLARGHEAVVLAAGPFSGHVRDAGLEFVDVWPAAAYEREALDPALWDPARSMKLVTRILGEQLQTLWNAVESVWLPGRTVVVAHTLAFAPRAFAEKHDVPAATLHLSPSVFRSDLHQPAMAGVPDLNRVPRVLRRPMWWMLDRLAIDPMIAPALNRFRRTHGVTPLHRIFRDAIHSPRRVLGLFPQWFAPKQPDWPAQTALTGFPFGTEREDVDAELESWLAAGDPPVVVTPGTANRQAATFLSAAVEAITHLGRRVLLATPWREQIPGELPANARSFAHLPLATMLHRCAAIVHHGGIGTCAQGLRSGVPQLVMPMAFDQPDNAARLGALGVGRAVLPKNFTAANVIGELDVLLSNRAVASACRRWSEESAREDGIHAACDALETVR